MGYNVMSLAELEEAAGLHPETDTIIAPESELLDTQDPNYRTLKRLDELGMLARHMDRRALPALNYFGPIQTAVWSRASVSYSPDATDITWRAADYFTADSRAKIPRLRYDSLNCTRYFASTLPPQHIGPQTASVAQYCGVIDQQKALFYTPVWIDLVWKFKALIDAYEHTSSTATDGVLHQRVIRNNIEDLLSDHYGFPQDLARDSHKFWLLTQDFKRTATRDLEWFKMNLAEKNLYQLRLGLESVIAMNLDLKKIGWRNGGHRRNS